MMKSGKGLCPGAFGLSLGIIAGLGYLITGLMSRGHETTLVTAMGTIQMGSTQTVMSCLMSGLWGLIGGFVVGFLIAVIYNCICKCCKCRFCKGACACTDCCNGAACDCKNCDCKSCGCGSKKS